MPHRLLALLLALGGGLAVLALSQPAEAATCSPISVSVAPNGQVTLTSDTAMTYVRIYHATDGTDNARIIPQGQSVPVPYPPSGSLDFLVNATSYSFRVTVLSPGLPTTVPVWIEDSCGAWSTFVGGGQTASASFSTAAPIVTPSPTPFIPPPTPTKAATLTPNPTMTLPQLSLSTSSVPAGGALEVGWTGISGAHQYDWLRFMTSAGADGVNPIVYTSTCKDPGTTPNLPARGTGSCLYQVKPNTPAGQYQLKLYKYGVTNPVAVSRVFSVTVGASQSGGGKLMTVRSDKEAFEDWDNPDPGLGGYAGARGFLKPQWSQNTPNETYSLVGIANRFHPFNPQVEDQSTMLWFPGGWSEAGLARDCPQGAGDAQCQWYPYGSWGDRFGTSTQYILDGSWHRSVYLAAYWRYYEFETTALGGGRWTQDFCGGEGLYSACCPLWPEAALCAPDPIPSHQPPSLTLDGMKFLFFGQETPSPNIAAGLSVHKGVRYCCRAWPTWDNWLCRPWFGLNWFEHSDPIQYPSIVETNRSCSGDGLLEWIHHSWRR